MLWQGKNSGLWEHPLKAQELASLTSSLPLLLSPTALTALVSQLFLGQACSSLRAFALVLPSARDGLTSDSSSSFLTSFRSLLKCHFINKSSLTVLYNLPPLPIHIHPGLCHLTYYTLLCLRISRLCHHVRILVLWRGGLWPVLFTSISLIPRMVPDL